MLRLVTAAAALGLILSLGEKATAGPPLLLLFDVDTTSDPTPDGSCNATPADDCSLREAVIAANTAFGNVDADINLPDIGGDGLADTFLLSIADVSGDENAAASGDLDLSEDINIFGRGPALTIIDANQTGRALHIQSGGFFVLLQGVAVTGGQVTNGYGAGILNLGGSLKLKQAAVTANKIINTDNFIDAGAGISMVGGSLDLEDTRVSRNRTQECATPPCTNPNRSFGGGISLDSAALTGVRVTISGNVASEGGGMYVSRYPGNDSDSTVELTDSRISGNRATSFGGAIQSDYSSSSIVLIRTVISANRSAFGGNGIGGRATLVIRRGLLRNHVGAAISLFVSNIRITDTTIEQNGIGLRIATEAELERVTVANNTDYGIENFGQMTILNSTFSGNGNSQANEAGSAIRNEGDLSIENSTIAGNRASGAPGGIRNQGTVSLRNTIVAINAGPECGNTSGGTIQTLGYNLASDNSCSLTKPSDRRGVDPRLDTLKANGGPTKTRALKPGSPAIDTGPPNCPPPGADQRLVSRPRDGNGSGGARCDRGAFERKSPRVP